MNTVVIGMGWGDEGKGKLVNHLAKTGNYNLVARVNGTCQAGHTVEEAGKRHVFSHFGAGTLQGLPTFWTEYCPVSPLAWSSENKLLTSYNPNLTISLCSPVITPWDIRAQRSNTDNLKHGSVGSGFWACLQRHKNLPLIFDDFIGWTNASNACMKICKYYGLNFDDEADIFEDFYDILLYMFEETGETTLNNLGKNSIIECAQGVLLDKDCGLSFPNLTPSNTFAQHISSELSTYDLALVTRTFHTRHGPGVFLDDLRPDLVSLDKTNVPHQFQGEFRAATLNQQAFEYALNCVLLAHPKAKSWKLYTTWNDVVNPPDWLLKYKPTEI
jgi:adenylosuccinate synthase